MWERVLAIEGQRFAKVNAQTKAAMEYAQLELEITEGGNVSHYNITENKASVVIHSGLDNATLEKHLAHEFSHLVAAVAGFSYRIEITTPGFQTNEPLTQGEEKVHWLRSPLGSYLTHIAVHSILAASGYDDPYFDNHILKESQNRSNGHYQQNRLARANLVGLAIQYHELTSRELPSIDLAAFKKEARRLNPQFDNDFALAQGNLHIGNLLDVQECLTSTRSLAAAMEGILGFPLSRMVKIEVARWPIRGWDLQSIIERLQAA